METAWSRLGEARQVGDDTWVALQPEAIAISNVSASGTEVVVSVQLLAKPIACFGREPQAHRSPLPKIGRPAAAQGVRLQVRGEFPFAEAERLGDKTLATKDLLFANRPLRISKVRVYGSRNLLVVGLDLRKPFQGTIYLTGTPCYDLDTGQLTVPDLDYTMETKSLLARVANWMLHEPIQEQLRGQLRFDAGGKMHAFQAKYCQLSTNFGELGKLNISLRQVQPRGVYLTSTAIVAVVDLEGEANTRLACEKRS